MNIAVFGLGYVGLTSAACLTLEGHRVFGLEANQDKAARIRQGMLPIFEPGLADVLRASLADERLTIAIRADRVLEECELALVCVGTPSAADGAHNMTYVAEVTRQIAQAIIERERPLTVVYRSTMRPGSMEALVAPIFRSRLGDDRAELVELVYNPEFLRESTAIADYFEPPRIVVGTRDGAPSERIAELYRNIDAPVIVTGFREAEFTKFVDNAWHAVKVAYANEIGRLCVELGISARKVHEIFVADTKLNLSAYYTRPGGAFGGSCLPKEVRALAALADELGTFNHLLDSLMRSNEAHKRFLFDYATRDVPKGARVLLVGLAFKPDSDDLRESPHLDLARRLLAAGYSLEVHDPAVRADQLVGQNMGYAFSHLPELSELLIGREEAESRSYDLVIDTAGRAGALALTADRFVDIGALP